MVYSDPVTDLPLHVEPGSSAKGAVVVSFVLVDETFNVCLALSTVLENVDDGTLYNQERSILCVLETG